MLSEKLKDYETGYNGIMKGLCCLNVYLILMCSLNDDKCLMGSHKFFVSSQYTLLLKY